MRNRINLVLKVLFLCVLTFDIAFRVCGAIVWNKNLEKNFVRSSRRGFEEEPYALGLPMDDWDLKAYTYRYTFHWDYNKEECIYTPAYAVTWYTQPDETSQPAVTLEASKNYVAHLNAPQYGGGFYSWPTYKKGWRYSVPFTTVLNTLGEQTQENGKLYYVKLEDLTELYDCATPKNQDSLSFRQKFLAVDMVLYQNGCYISPDLYRMVWDIWDTLLVLGAAGIVLSLLIPRARQRHNKHLCTGLNSTEPAARKEK